MRDAAIAIIREIGVEAGGCNIQFAVTPPTARCFRDRENPRVSRSSALASRPPGSRSARIGTKLAVGYTLDELPNDITKKHARLVRAGARLRGVKVPRFAFEKFPTADFRLTTQMKSVGEAMGHRPHVQGGIPEGTAGAGDRPSGLGGRCVPGGRPADERQPGRSARRTADAHAGARSSRSSGPGSRGSRCEVAQASGIESWFLFQMKSCSRRSAGSPRGRRTGRRGELRRMKRMGFSDRQLGPLRGPRGGDPRTRWRLGGTPP